MSNCEICEHVVHDEFWDDYICKKRGRTLKPIWLYKNCEYFKEQTNRKEKQDET